MKKMILAAVAVAVVGMSAQTARAGHRDWAVRVAVGYQPVYASASYGYAAPGYDVRYTVSAPLPCPPPRPVCAPRAVYYAPRPVYCAPAPVYHVSHGYAGHGHGRGHGRGWGCR